MRNTLILPGPPDGYMKVSDDKQTMHPRHAGSQAVRPESISDNALMHEVDSSGMCIDGNHGGRPKERKEKEIITDETSNMD